jgi:hypothetical protein
VATTGMFFLWLIAINIYLHPFQNVYFNLLARQYFQPIEKQFEVDYWGLSYKQGLEYLLNLNTGPGKIKLYALSNPGSWNMEALKKEDQDKFDFKLNLEEADYAFTNHRMERARVPDDAKIIYEIKRFGIPIITIYKLR